MPGYNDIEFIQLLFGKHLRSELTDAENQILQEWINASPDNKAKYAELTDAEQLFQKMALWQLSEENKLAAWHKLESVLYQQHRQASLRKLQRYAIAASIVLIVGIAAFWMVVRQQEKKPLPGVVQVNKTTPQQDIAPGGFKARLTLSDGSTVTLDNNANGEVTKQGSMAVLNKDGGLIYQANATKKATDKGLLYNTLTTARGETYAITLSDGSRVWLNSESSVHYPVTFNGNTRDVQITGEAYFEVAHNAGKPFRVDAGGTVTEVLGTHFNINTYGDEHPVVTTLLEGKIKIVNGSLSASSTILTPGQQATITGNKIIVKDHADAESAVAWMKGFFDFHNADIKSVMKQVSRWYNVDVQYTGAALPAQAFEGNIDRNIPLSELLSTLQQMGSGITYKVDGRTVRVVSGK
jgi:ferric-dicitrate binding protein FerR (iron transport regulator)